MDWLISKPYLKKEQITDRCVYDIVKFITKKIIIFSMTHHYEKIVNVKLIMRQGNHVKIRCVPGDSIILTNIDFQRCPPQRGSFTVILNLLLETSPLSKSIGRSAQMTKMRKARTNFIFA